MRKQYLLALMASVVCGMSVEAQVMDDYPAVSLQDVWKEASRFLPKKQEASARL